MKKKYILLGILVFVFSAIVVYLVLDNGNETYAVDATCPSNVTVNIVNNVNGQPIAQIRSVELDENCCKNVIGFSNFTNDDELGICTQTVIVSNSDRYYNSKSSKYCANDYTYDAERERCYYTPNTCPSRLDNIRVVEGSVPLMYFDGDIDRNCCLNILNGEVNVSTSECYIAGVKTNNTYYFIVPSSAYCASGYTYTSSNNHCTKSISTSTTYTLKYSCGDGITCDGKPSNVTQTDNNHFSISNKTPERGGYKFDYWVAGGTKHYYSSCTGVNDSVCEDDVYITNSSHTVTLTAHWTKTGSSGGGTSTNPSLTYSCGDQDCTGLPSTQYAKDSSGGTLAISTTVPKAKNSDYVFKYWTHNPPKSYVYSSSCTGISNCKTSITIKQNNTLYANWEKRSGSSQPTQLYLIYKCGTYNGDDVDCELPENTLAVDGKAYITSEVPTAPGLTFKYWTRNGVTTTYCLLGCDKNYLSGMTKNNLLYANWEESGTSHEGEYEIEYICDEGDCSGISNTIGNKSPLTITEKVPKRDGYIFLYWEPEPESFGLYCNPANEELDCIKKMWFKSSDIIRVHAVWMKDNGVEVPDDPTKTQEPTANPENTSKISDNPQTGSVPVYIAFAIGLGMLGYSYFYAKKLKEN